VALNAGTRLGPYEIVGAIGAGGMGEVYKATDTRLSRTVAIKVMPPHFAGDPDMKQRFDREAQTIAGLNHPNICTLHDVGSDAGVSFLVMEFLEGETLADRIARGGKPASGASTASLSGAAAKTGAPRALSIDDALKMAIAMADALDKAHRQGIVHRDLKPANVMLVKGAGSSTPMVKLLDFGLAKWTTTASDTLAAAPTRADLSTPGMLLGTLQYMAPEQLEGKEADARTDIFAFGAVLYEMITGRRAFQGKSQATLISAIMTGEPPPISTLQPLTPSALDHLVQRCLAKDPEDRWQDAHSVWVQLRWIAQGRSESEVPAAAAAADRKRARLTRVALVVAGAVIAALAVPTVLYVRGPAPPEAFPLRVPVVGLSRSNIAISPDGREIALVAQPDPQEPAALYVRPVNAATFLQLDGTDDAALPFWSPDSRSIAFVSGGRLKRVGATGGAPKDISPVMDFAGGAWSEANVIVFGSPRGLLRVSAEGGTPEALTTVEKPETGHFWPAFLPDGNHFLFTAWSAEPSNRAVYVGALDSRDRTKLMPAESNAMYASGHLLFHRAASLFAQPFDAQVRTLSGDARQVAGELAFSASDGRGLFDASRTGVLIFYQGENAASGRGQTGNSEFAWVGRTGRWIAAAIEGGPHGDMDLSPDQKLIAITKQEVGAPASDIVVVEWEKGLETRLTLDPADDINPVWSHDGSRIAFTSYRRGNADIFVKNANGVGPDTPLVQTSADEFVEAWSGDGRYIAYLVAQDRFQDIYALPLEQAGKPFPVVQGAFRKDEPQFSYDGKWLAYTSDESSPGKFEVYVISFPQLDQKRKVSIDGGGQPRWRKDSKELYYRTVESYMAVDFMPGPRIDSGVPHAMFPRPTLGGGNSSSSDPVRHQWAAAPDGQRFLLRVPPGPAGREGGGLRGGGRAANTFVVPGATPNAGRGRGPRGAARGLTAPALTVILHWPAGVGKAGR
jgi:Tol biopolymer transport system component/tRNA A-37 threonylcarbamoyl transferase component Bud32